MRARYNYIAVVVLGMQRREFYRMNPGLFFDMVQIHAAKYKRETNNAEID